MVEAGQEIRVGAHNPNAMIVVEKPRGMNRCSSSQCAVNVCCLFHVRYDLPPSFLGDRKGYYFCLSRHRQSILYCWSLSIKYTTERAEVLLQRARSPCRGKRGFIQGDRQPSNVVQPCPLLESSNSRKLFGEGWSRAGRKRCGCRQLRILLRDKRRYSHLLCTVTQCTVI